MHDLALLPESQPGQTFLSAPLSCCCSWGCFWSFRLQRKPKRRLSLNTVVRGRVWVKIKVKATFRFEKDTLFKSASCLFPWATVILSQLTQPYHPSSAGSPSPPRTCPPVLPASAIAVGTQHLPSTAIVFCLCSQGCRLSHPGTAPPVPSVPLQKSPAAAKRKQQLGNTHKDLLESSNNNGIARGADPNVNHGR